MNRPRSGFAGLVVALLACSCAAAPGPSVPAADPATLALDRVRTEEVWSRDRHAQLDMLFARAVGAGQSRDALEWLRVYVLAQVADRQDRDTRAGEVDALSTRLDQVAKHRERAASAFGGELAMLRGEVDELRRLYAAPLADPGPVASLAVGPEPTLRE